jgi:hypothetical protein
MSGMNINVNINKLQRAPTGCRGTTPITHVGYTHLDDGRRIWDENNKLAPHTHTQSGPISYARACVHAHKRHPSCTHKRLHWATQICVCVPGGDSSRHSSVLPAYNLAHIQAPEFLCSTTRPRPVYQVIRVHGSKLLPVADTVFSIHVIHSLSIST